MVNQTDKNEINEIISLIENKIKNNIALNEIAVLSRTHQLPEGIILHLILKKIPVFVSKDMFVSII